MILHITQDVKQKKYQASCGLSAIAAESIGIIKASALKMLYEDNKMVSKAKPNVAPLADNIGLFHDQWLNY